jgi:HEAT repeat protein
MFRQYRKSYWTTLRLGLGFSVALLLNLNENRYNAQTLVNLQISLSSQASFTPSASPKVLSKASLAPSVSPKAPNSKPLIHPTVSPKTNDSQKKEQSPGSGKELKEKGKGKESELHWQQKLAWGGGVLLVISGFYLFVYCFRPIWLLKIPLSELKVPKNPVTPEFKVPILKFFKYPERALDAWVAERIEQVQQTFEQRPTVQERQIHVSMPVHLNKQEVELQAKILRDEFGKRKQFWVVIWGEGGGGKTSLACQIARWAMDKQANTRLCKHRMLPILIEEELEVAEGKEGKQALFEAIARQVKNLRDEEQAPPEELLQELLKKRRILVIVDQLSEMSESSRKAVRLRDASSPVNALVVTSRLETILGAEVTQTKLSPIRVSGNQLSIFMDAYLSAQGKRQLFEDEDYFEYLKQLSQLTTDERAITILFAKLYANQMIALVTGKTIEDLPKNLPELMLSYLNELNRNHNENRIEDSRVHDISQVVAWECTQKNLKPEAVERNRVISALEGFAGDGETSKQEASQWLSYLESRLCLIRAVPPAKRQIRMILDPLTEYLAALNRVEKYGADESQWREFLVMAKAKPSLDEIRDFLLALRDCCSSVIGVAQNVPDFVVDELGQLAKLDLEALKQEQLRQRVKRLIADLSVPEAEDRRRSVGELGKIGAAAQKVVPDLLKAIKDKDSVVRTKVGEALINIAPNREEVISAVAALLKDEEASVRSQVAGVLSKSETDCHIVNCALLGLLKDSEASVRSKAIEALGQHKNYSEDISIHLVALLKDEDASVRSKTVETLGKLGANSEIVILALIPCLKDEKPAVRDKAATALAGIGVPSNQAVSKIVALLKDEDASVRSKAVEVLGKLGIGSETVALALIHHLKDEKPSVRAKTAAALEGIGVISTQIISELEILLNEPDITILPYAMQVIIKIGFSDDEVRTKIMPLFNDKNLSRRFKAIDICVKHGSPFPEEELKLALVDLLKKGDNTLSYQASALLTKMEVGTTAITLALLSCFESSQRMAVYYAAEILVRFKIDSEDVGFGLVSYLTSEDTFVRNKAAETLVKLDIKSEAVIMKLLDLLRNKSPTVREIAINTLNKLEIDSDRIISTLIVPLQTEDSTLRSIICEVLGTIGNKSARVLIKLESLLTDQDSLVSLNAAKSLVKLEIFSDAVISAFVNLLKAQDISIRVDSIQMLGKLEVNSNIAKVSLLQQLQDSDSSIRSHSATTLGKIGLESEDDISKLVALLKDSDSSVRSTIAKVLGGLNEPPDFVIHELQAVVSQDGSSRVREQAEIALKKIQFGK